MPFVFTLQSLYLVDSKPYELADMPYLAFTWILFLTGYIIFRQ